MDLSLDRLQERIERLQSDALHAFDPAYQPREPLVAARSGDPAPQASLQAPLPCQAPEHAFLVFDDGGGGRRYVREASLALRDGAVVDDEGRALLGYAAGASPASPVQRLRVDRRDALLGRAVALRIDRDGRVAYARRVTDAGGSTTTQWTNIGRLALARLDSGIPQIAPPGEENLPTLPVTRVQGGRVDLVHALERLQEAYLQLDAMRAARVAQDAGERAALGVVK